MDAKYITYHINGIAGNYTPIAVSVSGLTAEQQSAILNDALSLAAISRVNVNSTGRVRKDALIIDSETHFSYDWAALDKAYYNKFFNPANY